MKYDDFVDYRKLDPVKKAALSKFTPQMDAVRRMNMRIVPETIGETAIAIEMRDQDFYLAFNVEGLGTKNMIADAMSTDSRGKGIQYYESVGIDCVAVSTNDLSAIGADPFVYGDILSTGHSNWFDSQEKADALLEGFRKAAETIGMAIPCGETPTLTGIIAPETIDMAGASIGIIQPKEQLVTGHSLKEGDHIYGISSSGVHANGISLIRKTVESLPEGYFTELPGTNQCIGEALLEPTHLYSPLIREVLKHEIPHYMQPITGHGWQKIMRHRRPFGYSLEHLPEIPRLFSFLQENAGLSDEEAYFTWNMGLGFVFMGPPSLGDLLQSKAEKAGFSFFELGKVTQGEKAVHLIPKNIRFTETST